VSLILFTHNPITLQEQYRIPVTGSRHLASVWTLPSARVRPISWLYQQFWLHQSRFFIFILP